MYRYPVILKANPKSKILTVTFPDVPEATTQGRNVPDALNHAVDALETALSMYMDSRRDIPLPGKAGRSPEYVDLPPISAAKVALYRELRQAGMRKADLARKLGWQKSQVDRLLDLMHKSRLDQLEQALRVLGKVIVLEIRGQSPSRTETRQSRVAS